MSNSESEGILLLNKQQGKTAFDLVRMLRKCSGVQKIGHAGTLDPFATGVMVLLIGRFYTKLSHQLIHDDKEYLTTIKFGEETDTFDCEGAMTQTSSYIPSFEKVNLALTAFQGTIEQIPPMFSAKKIGGKKLYLLARKGIKVERKPVLVQLKMTLLQYAYPELTLQIACSKGTYIRSIARDLGRKLGCFGHLKDLERTKSGNFYLTDCIQSERLQDPNFSYLPYLRKSHETI